MVDNRQRVSDKRAGMHAHASQTRARGDRRHAGEGGGGGGTYHGAFPLRARGISLPHLDHDVTSSASVNGSRRWVEQVETLRAFVLQSPVCAQG
jgi:hypothetical protein